MINDYEFNSAKAEIKRRIVAAIRSGYGSISGIKKSSNIEVFRDISDHLDELLNEKLIRRVSKGDLVAYFPFEKMPTHFHYAGGGKVEAEFDEEFVPRDDEAKAAEMHGLAAFNAPYSENGAKQTENRGPRKRPPLRIEIDAAKLEELAATLQNADEVAKALGFSGDASLYYRFKSSASLKEAYDRGRSRNPMANKTGKRRGAQKTVAKKRAAAGEPKLQPDTTEAAPIDFTLNNYPLQMPQNGSVKEVAVTGWPTTTASATAEPAVPVNAKYVTFRSGAQIVIGFEGNVFDLTPNEMVFVMDLGERLRAYQEGMDDE